MTINDILKGSKYSEEIFNDEAVDRLNAKIEVRVSRGKDTPFVKCLKRNKDIQLKPEEVIRQLFLDKLLTEYNYGRSSIQVEYPVNFGRQTKRADIVIIDKEYDSPYIIVELKKPKFTDGKEQLRSYCNGTGAPLGVWTNGEQIEYYHRKDPNYFTNLIDIPKSAESLSDFLDTQNRFTYLDLILEDKLQKKSLKQIIQELEDEVLANAGVDAFEEPFKLIFTKLWDEKKHQKDLGKIETYLDAVGIDNIYDLKKDEYKQHYEKLKEKLSLLDFRASGTESEVYDRIDGLFKETQKEWRDIFQEGTSIELSRSHTSIVVSYLQNIKLFNSNLEVVDEAFEYLVNKNNKGNKGQYFTPRYVIDMCVKMLNPQPHETMIDTAAGSCGFTVHTIFHVWRKLNPNENHLFTAEEKTDEQKAYVRDKVFAMDFDKKAVRVGRTLNLIAGDGETNVLHMNTLDYDRWNELKKEKSWTRTYDKGFERLEALRTDKKESKGKANYKEFRFDIVMANPPFAGEIKDNRVINQYDLGHKLDDDFERVKVQEKISRDILFIERNLDFLKPGGRMAVVLPQGRFNNSSDKRLREYIAKHCRILAVVGLHGNTFKPHTGTKTSVLFLQKWNDNPEVGVLCPKQEDYPIFFATQLVKGKDNSGEKLYYAIEKETTTDPKEARQDRWYHYIVAHDLYNHGKFVIEKGFKMQVDYETSTGEIIKKGTMLSEDLVIDEGETSDGIAEAFMEFSKKDPHLDFF
ncbi:N-6 DNA methylase [Flagellimonas sp. S3867]|uniref:N-6 DNA methylase n=1 Tax=Flagellimonas sp. S3867 TaxID=2768063 RepID=UPI0016845C5D|nr:N-6 DNA methylase [Flagellimonas sp. S3867]